MGADRVTVREAVGRLAAEGVEFFSIGDLEKRLGVSRRKAVDLAQRMARVNVARRLKGGLYAVLPPTDWLDDRGFAVSWYWTAANLVRGDPYFIAYYTAMDIHNMTQHPIRTIFVAVTRRRRDVTVGPARFRFVTLAEQRFFGGRARRFAGHPVQVADLERTFLDCVDRMDLCGGLGEVARGFDRRHRDLDRDRLLRYVLQFDRPVAGKRLGFLLETVGHGDVLLLRDLERLAGRLKRYVALDPTRDAETTERNRRWELDVNVDVGKLVQGLRT